MTPNWLYLLKNVPTAKACLVAVCAYNGRRILGRVNPIQFSAISATRPICTSKLIINREREREGQNTEKGVDEPAKMSGVVDLTAAQSERRDHAGLNGLYDLT